MGGSHMCLGACEERACAPILQSPQHSDLEAKGHHGGKPRPLLEPHPRKHTRTQAREGEGKRRLAPQPILTRAPVTLQGGQRRNNNKQGTKEDMQSRRDHTCTTTAAPV